MRFAIVVLAAALMSAAVAEARTVVKMEPNGVKTVRIDTPRGLVIVQCDRNNTVIGNPIGPLNGMDPREICRRN